MEYTLDYFTGLAEDAIAGIAYPTVAPGLYEPIRYTMASGGKRLRPALCLAAYAALSHRTPEAIARQAIAIEMFHNFTLLHDDVMDNADIRRGRPTVHRRSGQNAAILSGDAMLTMAYGLLADGSGVAFADIFEVFNRTAMEVYQGQQLDMEYESRTDVSVEEYIEMISLKTSVLIACACRIGAMLAGADEEACRRLYDYGLALGLAFQLRDDWLDTFGDPAVFGKEIGGDIANNKKTWLLITALNEAPDHITPLLSSKCSREEKVAEVTRIYRELGLDRRCDTLAAEYASKAISAIEGLDIDAAALAFFKSIATNAATRNH
ncbi:MAG: polyprenyl synthetase family protein [Muribaculaceae bacterium]|nr:polyprenyl synthetase family protein [Muribaculaceae bacterium]